MIHNTNTFSILFPEGYSEFQVIQPVFFQDLQLEGILKAITSKYMGFDINKYFYTLPNSQRTILFRQNVYKDLEKNPSMVTALKQYIYRIQESENCFRYYLQVEDMIKKGSYLLLTCRNYLEALEKLSETLEKSDISSEGFQSLKEILEEMFAEEEFTGFRQMVEEAFSYMEQMNLTLLVKDSELSVLEQESQKEQGVCERIQEYLKAFGVEPDKKDATVHNIFPAPLETCALENTIIEILQKSRPQIFEVLKRFASCGFSLSSEDFFLKLKNEILFYICFFEFEQQLKEVGYPLQFPQICAQKGMKLKGVYDVALAWKNRFSGYSVVKNDICYQSGKSFLVITGPNQGGKTTLARGIGQCVYFMLIGLKAPCDTMTSSFFESILTHFEVEESVETGAGKLKEELQRLKPMMQDLSGNRTHNFVILNELFTTATTYDARIMAQKVMKHFMENQCMGIYVTHIQELADEKSQEGAQSMVAQLDPENPSVRTFKIIPMEAKGLGYSDSIVRKYELDFEHVTSRISGL